MQQLPALQKLVLMLQSLHQSYLILTHYAQISCRVVFGMENQLEDVKILQLLAPVIQEQPNHAVYSLNLDKNALKQQDFANFL